MNLVLKQVQPNKNCLLNFLKSHHFLFQISKIFFIGLTLIFIVDTLLRKNWHPLMVIKFLDFGKFFAQKKILLFIFFAQNISTKQVCKICNFLKMENSNNLTSKQVNMGLWCRL